MTRSNADSVMDFASAAMQRVLAQGLRELGLDAGDPPEPAQARVALDRKRSLVAHAVRQGGMACLPRLGQGLHRLAHEPTHDALSSARSVRDLIERWQRLERYIHSRHRCLLLHLGDAEARLHHVALGGMPPPLPVEDLVVLGVLAALFESLGLQQVEVHLAGVTGGRVYPDADAAALERAVAAGATAQWDFRWAGAPRRHSAAAAVTRWPVAQSLDPGWPPLVQQVYLALAGDLTQQLPLPRLADRLGLAARSLQRGLARSGQSSTRLLAEARCRAGAWHLLHTDLAVAEIGFLCGYADQPHFTRELQRRVGLAPAAYRRAFMPGA